MTPSRRDFLKAIGGAIGGLAVPAGSLLAACRQSPGNGAPRERNQVAPGPSDKVTDVKGDTAWLYPCDRDDCVWRVCPGLYLRTTRRGRWQRWEIFADEACTELLAREIFTSPQRPHLFAVRDGVRLDVGESPDGWIESRITRRPGRRN